MFANRRIFCFTTMIVQRKRYLNIAICGFVATVFFILLYRNISYNDTLNLKTTASIKHDVNFEESAKTPKRVINADAKIIMKSTNVPKSKNSFNSSTDSVVKNLNNTTVTKRPQLQENLMKVLHKYSLYNPGFRQLTEWPPMQWLTPENPTLAEVWGFNTTGDLPNWKKFLYQISKHYLYEDTPFIEDLLHDMATKKIIAVEQHPGGSQFKLIILYEDGGRALFKPMRFPRDVERDKNIPYLADYERHVSEIAAFHLDRILGFRRVPPVVGRKMNVTGELFPLVLNDIYMVDTFFLSPDGNYCFAGICQKYCSELYGGFCGDPYMLEGSFAFYVPPLPVELLVQRQIVNPWMRTYVLNKKAEWEDHEAFCQEVVQNLPPFNSSRRIYDAIDCAIFDFLIGNENRDSFDEFAIFGEDDTPTMIHYDNGQGFGRSDHDVMSILDPLSSCCVVRLTTFNKLYEFYVGPRPLSDLMRESLAKDPVSPVLTESHLQALDRRVEIVLQLIALCIKTNNGPLVLKDDIM